MNKKQKTFNNTKTQQIAHLKAQYSQTEADISHIAVWQIRINYNLLKIVY